VCHNLRKFEFFNRISNIIGERTVVILRGNIIASPRKYPYFDVVVGLVWSHDPKSYAGGSVCY
jgi:hypothetical protein